MKNNSDAIKHIERGVERYMLRLETFKKDLAQAVDPITVLNDAEWYLSDAAKIRVYRQAIKDLQALDEDAPVDVLLTSYRKKQAALIYKSISADPITNATNHYLLQATADIIEILEYLNEI